MTYIDIKVACHIRKLKTRYDEDIWYNDEKNIFQTVADGKHAARTVSSGIDPQEIHDCLTRLEEYGYIRLQRVWGGDYFFITSKLNHWFRFALDSFNKRFLGGFITGVATTIVGGLAVTCILSAMGI